jgi:hypothetical protein
MRLILILASATLFALSNTAVAKKHAEYAPQAPLPQIVLEAKSIFLVNDGGVDPNVKIDGAAVAYDYLYNAFSKWGHYEFAKRPSEADLVVYISYSAENPRQHTYSTTNSSTGQTQVHSRTVSDPTLRAIFVDSESGTTIWQESELRKKTRTFFGLGNKRRSQEVVNAADRLFTDFISRFSQE